MKVMIMCKWNNCNQALDVDVLEHLGAHIGYPKANTFVGNCKWDDCGLPKKTRGAMLSHILVHMDFRPYQCDCGKSFKRKRDRLVHMRKCHKKAKMDLQRAARDPIKEIIYEVERLKAIN